MKVQKLNQRQACWTLYLSRFDFILKYVPGTKIKKADGLSRRLDWKVGVEKIKKARSKDRGKSIEERQIADGEKLSIERGKSVCAKI